MLIYFSFVHLKLFSFRINLIRTMFKKSVAPAAERNKQPILEVLQSIIKVPKTSQDFSVKVLEIASGTGQHLVHFAKHMSKEIFWQPTEYDISQFPSICAYIQEDQLKNIAPPIYVDVTQHYSKWNQKSTDFEKYFINIKPIRSFEENSFDYIYNSNLIHISSFECSEGLFYNSGKLLKNGGCLIIYGPFGQNGKITPESNIQFDKGLRMSNPTWGVRDIQLQLIPLAEKNNLELTKIIDMPSNNKTLVWEKEVPKH